MTAPSVPGYVVEELLGRGGSGEVWRARVAATGDRVALKRLPVGDAERLRAALSEAALLATLDHPNLIRLHEIVPQAGALVLVLDLAAGGSLAELIAMRGRLTPGEVIATVAPIGAALAYAHNGGVVHGDVTPGNVLFTDFGLPLLADVGVARIVGDTAPVRTTPSCVDPSVAAGALPGPPTDVFMLAAVAVHALTGEPLWRGASAEEVLAAAVRGEHDATARLAAAGVPASIRQVLDTALCADPAARGTAADFALELRHAGEPVAVELSAGRARPSADGARPDFGRPADVGPYAGSPALTRGVRARPVAPRPVRRPLWRRDWVRWVAAAGCVLAAAGAGWAAWPPPGRAHPRVVAAPAPSPRVAADPAPSPRVAADPAPSSSGGARPSAQSVLARLDGVRAEAFARRDPQLLAGVYLPGPLRDADAALLLRLVPQGCGLVGVRTRYRDVAVVERSPGRLVVTATATLAESALVCHGSTTGHARGVGPHGLRVELVRGAEGYRVAAQRVG